MDDKPRAYFTPDEGSDAEGITIDDDGNMVITVPTVWVQSVAPIPSGSSS